MIKKTSQLVSKTILNFLLGQNIIYDIEFVAETDNSTKEKEMIDIVKIHQYHLSCCHNKIYKDRCAKTKSNGKRTLSISMF